MASKREQTVAVVGKGGGGGEGGCKGGGEEVMIRSTEYSGGEC